MSTPGRRALVTGGSGGIGAAICRRLAEAGHHVYVHAHQGRGRAEALVQRLIGAGGSAEPLLFDLTDEGATRRALEPVLEAGAVQILVHNAGIHDDAVLAGMSSRQWRAVLEVSLQGFYNITQPLLLPMIRTRWGRILAMSSVAALTGNRGQTNYAAAKGALISASRALALEVASRGITVNAVAPGIIATEMSANSFDAAAIARLVPLRRAGSSEEVASLVEYLASEQAAYVTGQVVSINGGMI